MRNAYYMAVIAKKLKAKVNKSYAIISDGVDDFINTGVTPDSNTVIEVGYRFRNPARYNKVFGTRNASNYFFLGVTSGNTQFYASAGSSATWRIISSKDSNYHESILRADTGYFTQDGATTNLFTPEVFSIEQPIFIFGDNIDGALVNATSLELYYMKIYQNGVLIRDFVPQGNGTLLDIVNNVTYYNSTDGGVFQVIEV